MSQYDGGGAEPTPTEGPPGKGQPDTGSAKGSLGGTFQSFGAGAAFLAASFAFALPLAFVLWLGAVVLGSLGVAAALAPSGGLDGSGSRTELGLTQPRGLG